MIINEKLLDRKGKEIKEKDRVIVSQYAQSLFSLIEFKNEKELIEMNELYEALSENVHWEHYEGNLYILKNIDGNPSCIELSEIISEKEAFAVDSKHDRSYLNIKKGDKVLYFGGEGFMEEVFNYPSYMLEIIS